MSLSIETPGGTLLVQRGREVCLADGAVPSEADPEPAPASVRTETWPDQDAADVRFGLLARSLLRGAGFAVHTQPPPAMRQQLEII